jgi:hypothetical protein
MTPLPPRGLPPAKPLTRRASRVSAAIEEPAKLNGKVASVTRLAVSSNPKSKTVLVRDAQDVTMNQFTMRKRQSRFLLMVSSSVPQFQMSCMPPNRDLTAWSEDNFRAANNP